ncbi:hypothetical protein [Nonomuraea helvata]|uniref:Uncharacterized protein n=1 Tax=Nonomuraea helvata TaxID=37484 RepID=A0ABV5S251_9ACTN
MAILTGITVPLVLAVVVFVATVLIGPFQEDVKEGVSASEPPVRVGIEESWNNDVDMGWVFDRPLSAQAVNELRRPRRHPVLRLLPHPGLRRGQDPVQAVADGTEEERGQGHRRRRPGPGAPEAADRRPCVGAHGRLRTDRARHRVL